MSGNRPVDDVGKPYSQGFCHPERERRISPFVGPGSAQEWGRLQADWKWLLLTNLWPILSKSPVDRDIASDYTYQRE